MKKSKKEAAETRQRIVKTAAAEFKRNGINGTGLSDLMAAAGLTHGGLLSHFDSKDQLVAESCAAAVDSMVESFTFALSRKSKRSGLEAIAASYLPKNIEVIRRDVAHSLHLEVNLFGVTTPLAL